RGHTRGVEAVALAADGRHALSGSDDGTLRWWDLGSGDSRELRGHTRGVEAVALAADGRHALSGSDDGTLRWWDLGSGSCLAVHPCDCPVITVALTCVSTETLAVAGGGNGQVLFFRIELS